MPFATWWRGDHLPDLSPLSTFSAHLSADTLSIAHLTDLAPEVVAARLQAGNRAYLAFMGEEPAAYGWVATQKGRIPEPEWFFDIPSQNCYLFNFLTLRQWRGHGIYPHLLQTIIRQEAQLFERIWIAYKPGNESSARGISKAGFHLLGDFFVPSGHMAGLTLFAPSERAQASVDFFQLPIRDE
jgi:GNAT superfamily N-acetyltransferase